MAQPMPDAIVLLEWCMQNTADYSAVEIADFSDSWRDGRAFCALLHRYNPAKIDFANLNSCSGKENLLLALRVAESVGIEVPRVTFEIEDNCVLPELWVRFFLTGIWNKYRNAEPPKMCFTCGKPIIGKIVEGSGGKVFHGECFVCAGCGVQLGEQFYTVNEKIYCRPCGMAAFKSSKKKKGGKAKKAPSRQEEIEAVRKTRREQMEKQIAEIQARKAELCEKMDTVHANKLMAIQKARDRIDEQLRVLAANSE